MRTLLPLPPVGRHGHAGSASWHRGSVGGDNGEHGVGNRAHDCAALLPHAVNQGSWSEDIDNNEAGAGDKTVCGGLPAFKRADHGGAAVPPAQSSTNIKRAKSAAPYV